jgi:histidine triad (HIT) family protein
MLSEQETEEIKEKIIEQIESTFSAEQIPSAVQQIKAMNSEQLEEFLEKNNISRDENPNSKPECVFCSIASRKIKSCEIGENEEALAVLEINPISKGHTMIVPKNHNDKLPKSALKLAKEISKNIKKKFKPIAIKSSTSQLFGHEVMNILPVYDKEDFNSERKKINLDELEKIKEELEKKSEKKVRKPRVKKIKEFLWLPKRIP